jgi:hypothetical protein
VNPKKTAGGLENGVHGLNPMPVPGKNIQAFESLGRRLRREPRLPFEA